MKGKTNIILIVVIAILGGVYYFTQSRESGERQKYDYVFHVEDTAAIHKIFIKDKTPHEVSLIRDNGRWMIEGGDEARPVAVKTLLKTFNQMRLKNFISESMKPTVLNRLAAHGIEVKLFDKSGNVMKHFFVGPPSMDELGSYMMNKGGDSPYAVFIPGFNGNLTTRFFADPIQWRKRSIWGFDNLDIKKVRLRYDHAPQNSFEIDTDTNNKYSLTRLIDKQTFIPDSIQVGLFFSAISSAQYQGAITPSDGIWAKRDSLKASQPAFDIYVENFDGDWKTLTGYRIKAPEDAEDEHGNPLEYDLDMLHAFITSSSGKESMVLAQYFGLQLVLVDIPTLVKDF